MVNLIYNAFPFGNSEFFAGYEIPYLNEIAGDQYRVISFYKGKDCKYDKVNDIQGKIYIVQPSVRDYLKGLISFFYPKVLKELKSIKIRKCRDSLTKCLWRMLYYRAYGYALREKVRNIDISDNEVFICYWLNECAYAAIMLKQINKSIKVVSRAHGFDVFEERCYLPFRNELFGAIDIVYPINRIEKQYLLDHYSSILTEEKVHVSHLGISIPKYYSLDDTRSNFTIVTCSSIIKLKRLDIIVGALSEITEFCFKWIHIGGGPLQEQIKTQANNQLNKSNQRYEFLGQIPLSQVHALYREHDVSLFVNCSDTEGVPVSIMEAMSYCIPVVARDVGGNSEIIDNNNGILLRANCSTHDLAEAIRKIYSMSNNEYISMKQAAREKVKTEFNSDIQYRRFFEEEMKHHHS